MPTPAASPSADERILIDNSNLSELKLTADEAVERILSRKSPTATTTATAGSPAAPWTVSHFHTDLRLVLGYLASIIMIAVGGWSYFVEKEWEVNKGPTAIAVVVYLVLSAVQTVDAYVQGNRIFYGSRKSSPSAPPEQLILTSPPLPKHKLVPGSGSGTNKTRAFSIPPEYALEVEYTRPAGSTGNSSGQKKKNGKVTVGHFGEWVTQEGEFVESVFEEKLRAGLAKVLGE